MTPIQLSILCISASVISLIVVLVIQMMDINSLQKRVDFLEKLFYSES